MALTPLATTTRFIMPGTAKVYYLPAIAGFPAACTRTEINSGTDLTNQIESITGFSYKANFVDVPDLSSVYVSKIPGRSVTDASSITFYGDKVGADVRETLTQGTSGFIVFLDGGDVPTQKMDEWAVTVSSVSVDRTGASAGTAALKVMVEFALTKTPGLRLTVPA